MACPRSLRGIRTERPSRWQLTRDKERGAQADCQPERQQQWNPRQRRGRVKEAGEIATAPSQLEHDHYHAERGVHGNWRLLGTAAGERDDHEVGDGLYLPTPASEKTRERPRNARHTD